MPGCLKEPLLLEFTLDGIKLLCCFSLSILGLVGVQDAPVFLGESKDVLWNAKSCIWFLLGMLSACFVLLFLEGSLDVSLSSKSWN